MNDFAVGLLRLALAVVTLMVVLCFPFWALPKYNAWRAGVNIVTQERNGAAQLARATQSRQVLIEQARAERDSAALRAEAIAIVGKAAQEYPEYRQQEFLGAFAEALKDGSMSQIIYVPTEANIPIMEAGARPITE